MEFDKEKAKRWIEEHSEIPMNCPICHKTKWLLVDKIWQLKEITDGFEGLEFLSIPNFMPLIAMMCENCGHTLFFNAFAIGVATKPKE